MAKLESDFRVQQRYKDATSRTLEARLRTARYMGVPRPKPLAAG